MSRHEEARDMNRNRQNMLKMVFRKFWAMDPYPNPNPTVLSFINFMFTKNPSQDLQNCCFMSLHVFSCLLLSCHVSPSFFMSLHVFL